MGSRPSRPTIEIPKPVAYQTTVPEEDFLRGDEYLDYLGDEEDDLIKLEYQTLGNPEAQRYDDRVDRMFELGSYNASLPRDDARSGFRIEPEIRSGLMGAFTKAEEDVTRARDEFEQTPQGGGPGTEPSGGGNDKPKGDLAGYMKFLRTYDHKARGAGSQKNPATARFSALDVGVAKKEAKKYGITDAQRNKAIIDATEGYKERGVRMGGGTARALEKLEKGGSRYTEAKKKSKDHKKNKDKKKDKNKDKDKFTGKPSAYAGIGRAPWQKSGQSTGRPGGG